jgi:hypothetical protein
VSASADKVLSPQPPVIQPCLQSTQDEPCGHRIQEILESKSVEATNSKRVAQRTEKKVVLQAIQSSRVDLERRIANPSVLSLRHGTSPPSTGSSPLPTPPTHQGQPHGGSVYGHTTPGGARYWTPQQHRRDTSASPVAESHRDHFQFSTSPAPVSLLAKDPRSGHVSPRDSVSPPGARAAAVHAAPPNTGRDWQGEDAGARKERVERIGGFDPDDIEWDAEVEM